MDFSFLQIKNFQKNIECVRVEFNAVKRGKMAELKPKTASFLERYFRIAKGDREEIYNWIYPLRDKTDIDEDLYNTIDEFLSDPLQYTRLAYDYRLKEKDDEINLLKNSLKEKAFSFASDEDISFI